MLLLLLQLLLGGELRDQPPLLICQPLVGAACGNMALLAAAEAYVLRALVEVVVGHHLALGTDVQGGRQV